jgi:hypothetical protein
MVNLNKAGSSKGKEQLRTRKAGVVKRLFYWTIAGEERNVCTRYIVETTSCNCITSRNGAAKTSLGTYPVHGQRQIQLYEHGA